MTCDMDKLSESQRASIAKMSDERLHSKLSKAGYTPDILIQFTRSDLMKAVAEVMVAENEQQAAVAAQFEVEEGVEDRPTEMESMAEVTDAMEERRILLEERRMELEQRKWRAEMGLREREMELRARELDRKRAMAEREQSAKESMASRLKLWGDGLRNTTSRMPTEPVEVVSWFIALEKLFDQLGVQLN